MGSKRKVMTPIYKRMPKLQLADVRVFKPIIELGFKEIARFYRVKNAAITITCWIYVPTLLVESMETHVIRPGQRYAMRSSKGVRPIRHMLLKEVY